MKKYDEYKDSGVAWIGEVPRHWEVIKLKYKYHFQTGATPNTGKKENFEGELKWANISDLNGSVVYDTTKHINKEAASKCSMNISPKGSLMYSFKLSVGTVAFCGEDMYTNEAIASFIPQKNDLKYLFYCAPIFIIHNANRNIYNAPLLNQELIKNALICLPSLNEQTAIATYLDTHCAKIDNLISIQQKRIALLQELKQSVITHAVTKGLNPNVEMKQSGVEWIGDVPKHWEVRKIKQCCNKEQYSIKTGPFGSQLKGEELMSQGDVSVYSQQNVINNDFNKIRYFVSNKKAKSLSSFYTRANDVLITSRGTIGKAAILQPLYPKGILHPCLIAIRLDQEVCLPEWLTMYINETDCFKTDISVNSNATTIDVIYTGTLKDIYIPIPPISEQAAIASYLDHKCATIDTSISNAQHQIDLLQEYKQSLITEVVTGKRKVTDN